MNERIEELAKECYEYVEGTLEGDIVKFDHKKFAKLIIQDCIDAVGGYRNSFDDPASDEIRELFGVK